MDIKETIREFFRILDTQEESDDGRVFHPVQISSCRVMLTARLSEVLDDMKEYVEE